MKYPSISKNRVWTGLVAVLICHSATLSPLSAQERGKDPTGISEPTTAQAEPLYMLEKQTRRNGLLFGTYQPAVPGGDSAFTHGYYWETAPFNNPNYAELYDRAYFTSAYLKTKIEAMSWKEFYTPGGTVTYESMKLYTADIGHSSAFIKYPVSQTNTTEYKGTIDQMRFRVSATAKDHPPLNDTFIKITKRVPYTGNIQIWDYIKVERFELKLPTGSLKTDWIEMKAPMTDGYDTRVCLLPVEVAVDADRDGEITFDQKDKTTAEKPFRFWINDDDDTFGEGNDTGGTLDRIPAVTPDHQNSFIDFIRDLEDFSRISFKLPDSFWSQIKAGEIQVGFKWSDTSDGNPAVNIFRQANKSAGQVQYFVDENEALDQAGTSANAAQKVMTVSGSGTAYFPQSFIDRLPTTSAPTYVLFEGAAKGKGKLNLVLKVNGQEVVCDGPWIKLMDVRQFYSRGRTSLTATQISDPWDSPNPPAITSVADNTPEFVADPDETEQCIIHVHGWRMTEGDSRNWSEMTFKRLWQLHYKGRFATFRWATFSDDTHPPVLGQELPSKLTYNRSEYRSWLCGPALAQFVNGLPYEGSRYLIAHSMGNVISGKALQDGMKVKRYVMCNTAMAAMSYDGTITNLPLSLNGTPDTDSNPATQALGLKNRFNDRLTTRINYYLPKDEALTAWIANNLLLKPDVRYNYDPNRVIGTKLWYTPILGFQRDVTNLAEAMGHVVKSRSDAIGAVGNAALGGSVSSSVGMDGFGFDKEHSAEWNWSLTSSYKFWRKLFVSFQIPTTAPQ